MIAKALYIIGIIMISCYALAQKPGKQKADQQMVIHIANSYDELRTFLSIPNCAAFPQDIAKNIEWLEKAFSKRGFSTQIISGSGADFLYTEKLSEKAKRTVLFYFHLDGQPVDSSKWDQESPYIPVLKEQDSSGDWVPVEWNNLKGEANPEWRIFCRSASDDKSPIIMFLTALDILREKDQSPDFNIKVLLDSEEEIGSPHLPEAVQRNKTLLQSDMMVIVDGPRHLSNQPTIYFGCRGISTFTLKVYGAKLPQHSGHYGNYAPNPAHRLATLLASMKDDEGRVIIPGYYDGIEPDDKTKRILASVPDDEQQIRQKIGIAAPDKVGGNYQEALQYPSLNVRGIASGWVGKEARTIVPDIAIAEVDIRLVAESDPERLIRLVKEHIKQKGYYLTDREPTGEERLKHPKIASFRYKISSRAFRTDMGSEVGNWLNKAMKSAFEQEPVRIRTMGGTLPISHLVEILDAPAVILSVANADNNQHSPNENLRIGNYTDGVKTFKALFLENF